jgi:hypothetical protein
MISINKIYKKQGEFLHKTRRTTTDRSYIYFLKLSTRTKPPKIWYFNTTIGVPSLYRQNIMKKILSISFFIAFSLLSSTYAADKCELTIAVLKYGGGGDWYANPSSIPNLIAAVRERTKIPLCDTPAVVEIMDEKLFRHPFVYMTGHGNVHFTGAERLRLRSYLTGGGFLWADDNYGMDKSFRREMAALFPENPLTPVPNNHPVYGAKYPLPGQIGRAHV